MTSVFEYIARMRAQALLDAQKHASWPTSKGGLGLSALNTPMERAQALGYTLPLWHSSPSPEIGKFNRRSWFANQPEISETYLQKNLEGSSMYPVLVNPEGFAEVDFGGAVWNQGPEKGTLGGFPEDSPHLDTPEERATRAQFNRSMPTTDSVARLSDQYRFPGAKISNVIDRGPNFWATPIEGGDVYVVHDPSRVRSRFAAFDPLRRHESEILASHPAATMMAAGGLSGLANKYLDQPMNMGPDVARVAKETGIQPMSRGEALKNAISAVPGIGDALAAAEGLQGAAEGDWKKAGLGALAAAPMVGAIKTYHGSPRAEPFSKFSKEFMGSGEGAQAFSKGHYVAERPGIAKSYAEMYGPMFEKSYQYDPSKIEGKLLKKDTQLIEKILKTKNPVDDIKNKINALQQDIDFMVKQYGPDSYDAKLRLNTLNQLTKLLPGFVQFGETSKPLRSLYEVSLEWPDAVKEAADPMSREHFFQWDRPFNKQPEHIQKALLDIIEENPPEIQKYKEILKRNWKIDEPNMVDFAKMYPNVLIRDARLEPHLYEKGIPGVAFADQPSRIKPIDQRTYNYVSYGDEIPRIVSHNNPSLLDMLWPNK